MRGMPVRAADPVARGARYAIVLSTGGTVLGRHTPPVHPRCNVDRFVGFTMNVNSPQHSFRTA